MFKKVLGILALSAIATMTWANVDLRTNIQDLYYKGSCEEAGAITMSVNGDDFTDASTDNPTFIRIRLDHDAVLCSSLVGSWSTRDNQGRLLDGFYGEPVFLAMRLEDKANPDNYILADPETVSIVRWIAGEGEIWLRVQSDSSTWIYSDTLGAPAPPAVNTGRVAWTFGVTAAKSYQRNQPLFTAVAQEANLPANTRDVTWETCTNDIYPSISTLICVDLEDATLMAMPDPESILNFDTISFKDTAYTGTNGVFTAKPGVTIDKGNQANTNFSGDDSIARGVKGHCVATLYKPKYAVAALCAEGGGQGSAENGLVLMEKSLSIKVDCTNGWHTGSNVYLYNANGGPWGFPLKLDTGNDETLSQRSLGNGWYSGPTNEVTTFVGKATSVWYSSIKQRGGYYLADEALMWYLSAGTLATKNTITILVEVGQYYLDPPGAVEIAVATYVTQRDDVWSAADWLLFMDESGCGDTVTADDLAWGGNLQYTNTYCGLGEVFAGQEVWTMGYFIPCEFEMSTEIFFPYLPRLTGTDYWTGIALVNHGGFDFPADGGLVGHIYEADGNHWTVEFPALPKQNMQTWLIADGPSGVGFSGATADPLTEGLFLTPETDGNDLSFGDVRFNMFVVGSYMTTSSAMNRSSFQPGDLDGYCLIGLGTSIDGAYLARNMEGVFDTGIDVPPAPNYKSVITLKSDEEVMAIISSAKKMKAELDK